MSKPYLSLLYPFPNQSFKVRDNDKMKEILESVTEYGVLTPTIVRPREGGAVRMVTEQGRQQAEVAKELGICIDMLRNWLKASGVQMGQASRLNREQQRIRELEAEVRTLRKQLGEKEEGIDVLNKSVGILSRP